MPYPFYNQYMQPAQQNALLYQQNPQITQNYDDGEVIGVDGINGAYSVNLKPGTKSVFVYDIKNQTIIYLISIRDGTRFVTAFDIAPHQDPLRLTLESIDKRLRVLEEKENGNRSDNPGTAHATEANKYANGKKQSGNGSNAGGH